MEPLKPAALRRAVEHLADGVDCEEAQTLKVLAGAPMTTWSPRLRRLASGIVDRHRERLHRDGVDLSGDPQSTSRKNNRRPSGRFAARINADEIVLTSPGWPGEAAVEAVKKIPGATFLKTPRPHWRVPIAAAAQVRDLVRRGLVEESEELRVELKTSVARQAARVKAATALDAEVEVADIAGELRGYQRVAVSWIDENRRGTILGDDMGTGKTVSTLAALWHLQAIPAVVVCPAPVKLHWRDTARRWLPKLRRVQVLDGTRPLPIERGVGLVVVNYDVLTSWTETLIAWKPRAVVFDEIHKLKNRGAKRTAAARRLAGARGVFLRLGLTGTPIENGPAEYMSPLRVLGRLREVGGVLGFTERFCVEGRFGIERGRGKNLEELSHVLRARGIMLRRTKADIGDELPARTRALVSLELRARKSYDEAVESARAKLIAARAEIRRAEAAGRDPEGWAAAAAMTVFGEVRRAAGLAKVAKSGKESAAGAWIREKSEQAKLLVFAWHVDVVEALAAELGCPMIHGQTPATRRQEAMRRFIEDSSCRVLVGNIGALGTGVDGLQHASSDVVFAEQGLTPAGQDQAEGRLDRTGQASAVTAWYLLADATIDGKIYDLVERKRIVVEAATDGERRKTAAEEYEEIIMAEDP